MLPEFQWPVHFCLFSTVSCYVLSILTANVSQVDRVWTFLPTIYTAYFALLPLWPSSQYLPLFPYTTPNINPSVTDSYSPRALLMLSLITVWMCRLSYNTYRRGLFAFSDEDYRWAVLRKQLHPILFQIVNLTFIAAIQNVLLFLLGLPTANAALNQPHSSLEPTDIAFALFALVVLILEFTADNQQYSFQTYKQSILLAQNSSIQTVMATLACNTNAHTGDGLTYSKSAQWPGARLNWTIADAKRGFVTKGLWQYSRHPNFACEQTFWWIITLMPLYSSSSDFSASIAALPSTAFPDTLSISALYTSLVKVAATIAPILPAAALSLLFFSSTLYTEAITLSKYPIAYKAYRERVGMFDPFKTWRKGVFLALKDPKKKAEVEALVWSQDEKKTQ